MKSLYSRTNIIRQLVLNSAAVLILSMAAVIPAAAQGITSVDRERAQVMLSELKSNIKGDYYDPGFHGVNIDDRFKAAEEMIKKATSLGQTFGIIAQAMMSLNDSHTFFLPPAQTVSSQYGWEMQAIGDRCYVVAVKPGSDADAKGLHPGDAVLALNGVAPTRPELWKIGYLYYTLRPQAGMRLLIETPDGQHKEIDVLAKVKTSKRSLDFTQGDDIWQVIRDAENEDRINRHRYVETTEAFIWKMPDFQFSPDKVDTMMDKVRKHDNLVLDLRGNPGGYEITMQRLVANLFDKDITVGNAKRRKETKPIIAKSVGAKAYKGKVIVLVDSESGSAAEILARTVQLQKRGVVIGDRTAGAVMEARLHPHQMGRDVAVFYSASITEADFLMPDGVSLEGVGVTPDTPMLPTAIDLSKKLDPVLAYAINQTGMKIDAAKAGEMFPIEWAK